MTRAEEVGIKLERINGLLEKESLDGLLLTKTGNFAWLTGGGDNHVVSSMEPGIASLLVIKDGGKFILTDNIELPRLQAEELEGLGFEPSILNWYEGGQDLAIHHKVEGLQVGSDVAMPGTKHIESEIVKLQWSLLPAEIERYRKLGRDCAKAMDEVCRDDVEPGMTEFEVAAEISEELLERAIDPVVVLIAADERIKQFRHPIPTDNKVQKYCMVVICGERQGLIVSMTRLVHFGKISDDLKRRHQAVVAVDAAAIAASKPGSNAGEIFSAIKQAYADNGFADQWQHHHQGGGIGYYTRYWKAHREDDPTPILENQAFGWNPSITGTKSEDTIIAMADGPEIISPIKDWPMITVETEIGTIERPDILVL